MSKSSCFVSIYVVERVYGGPEEGGWWYHWLTLENSIEVNDREQAEQVQDRLLDQIEQNNKDNYWERVKNTANMPQGNSPYNDTEGYIPIGWGDGGERKCFIEETKGSYESKERPHYC
jgi:hypothetical protein